MSMRRACLSALISAVGASALVALPPAAPARADVDTSAAALALDLPAGVTVTSLAGAPASRAIADTGVDQTVDFNDFPSRGSSYLMLSTGDASKVFEGVPTSQLSTDFGDDGAPDASSITIKVAAGTPGAGCLFVDFALGTEEPTGYTASTPDDALSIVKDGTNYALNAGDGYFSQDDPDTTASPDWPESGKPPYEVNQVDYWHRPGDPLDPIPGTAEDPRLPAVTGLNHVTSLDTARVPLDVSSDQEVVVTVTDAPTGANGDLDSVAFVDDVRLASSCGNGIGVEPKPENQESPTACCGVIRGVRGVGNALVYDPIPSTPAVEMYDAPGVEANGWRSPSNKPVELRFRWYRTASGYRNNGSMRAWTAIPNADRQSYVPTSVDKGKVLIVLVTGLVDGRRAETFPSTNDAATWYVTLQIDLGTFVEGEAPVISGPADGSAAVGETLTAQIGDTVPRQDTYDWQWYAKAPGASGLGSSISGANGQSITLGEAQAGKVLTVRATAKRDQFADKTWTSPEYGPIEALTWGATGTPSIVDDGSPQVNDVVTVDPGAWEPTPTSYSYQWRRNGLPISGAVSGNYTLKAADAGASITVDVSGVRTGYAQVPKTSAPITPQGATMAGAVPTITGTPKVGVRLTGAVSGWSPVGSSLTYQWYVGETQVQSGTSRYFTPPASAVGLPVTLRVTGTRTGYEPLTVPSAPTAPVAKGALAVGTVRMSGILRVGNTLRASTPYWGPSPVSFKYRWKIGSAYVAAPAGTRSYLKLPARARGKRITLVVTASKAGYGSVTKSVVSAAVR
ncbi:hypothetical protein BJ993_003954 [Nocardioides aromaticivorans]|uniref:Uncharacterized protein n=1 Tax=Nocardioides aromaticivorans TaxID=200618 RepID=A0A7Z0CMZ6_9ACTN|nr:hypothetical protein [Nocardioides aromaticivorans]NYI46874.1 hypothetical protein [Nocardioides aromaticivorans]